MLETSGRGYRSLIVWKRSMQLSLEVYAFTRGFPREELYGLTSQMRRAVVSIISNIAEGHGRNSRSQLIQFLSIARGSSYEIEAQLLLAAALGYGDPVRNETCQRLCEEVSRMLGAAMKGLQGPERSSSSGE